MNKSRIVKALPPPACHLLNAAIGWLELGNPDEAFVELDQIPNEFRTEPLVLEVQWQIFARKDSWDKSLPVAETFCKVAPGRPEGWLHQAVSLYRLNRTQEAWNLLLPMAKKFPGSWVISYDLACYACQLGDLEAGRTWLKKAFSIAGAGEVRPLALADPDLKLLWAEIENYPESKKPVKK